MSRRIVLWSPGFSGEFGGIETLARAFVRAMLGRGHRFLVVTPNPGPPDPDLAGADGFSMLHLPAYEALAGRDPVALAGLRRLQDETVAEFGADLVHVNSFHPALVLLLGSRTMRRLPSIFTVHGRVYVSSEGTGADTVAGRLLRAVDWVVGCSEASLDHARRAVPEVSGHSSLILNGAPPLDDEAGPSPAVIDPPVLFCVGRVVEQKGFDLALRAVAALGVEFPSLRLVVGGDGPALPALVELANSLGVASRVRFTGRLEPAQVSGGMRAATRVLMPSRGSEGIPLVALEAAQRGRAVVASDVPGLREAVVHERTGMLVPPDDAVALEDSLRYLLASAQRVQALGEGACLHVASTFDWERHVTHYEDLYEQLARRGKRGDH
jgi:glycogen(starch) synthase